MSNNVIPKEMLAGIAELLRQVCKIENNYTYIEFTTIGDYNYKVTIQLHDIDEEKEAKITSITVKRED